MMCFVLSHFDVKKRLSARLVNPWVVTQLPDLENRRLEQALRNDIHRMGILRTSVKVMLHARTNTAAEDSSFSGCSPKFLAPLR
jgi:hypothetical protein